MILLDSNIIIYTAKAEFTSVRTYLAEKSLYASAASRIEVLGFHGIELVDAAELEEFFQTVEILPISDEIVEMAIKLRQLKKMSLGDSIIGATALVYDLVLATNNNDDFGWIEGLSLFNPLTN